MARCLGLQRQNPFERLVEDGEHFLRVIEEEGCGDGHAILHYPTVLDDLAATVMLLELPSTVLGQSKAHLSISAHEGVHVAVRRRVGQRLAPTFVPRVGTEKPVVKLDGKRCGHVDLDSMLPRIGSVLWHMTSGDLRA
jgi:hypothetical protein